MESRRFTLSVHDKEGLLRKGEVLLAERWQPNLGDEAPQGENAFLIVLLGEPAPLAARVATPGIAVCAPACRLPPVLREPAPAYADGLNRTPTFPAFPDSHMAAYADGRLIAAPALRITLRQLFPPNKATPRLYLLARAILRTCARPNGDDPTRRRLLAALAAALAAPAEVGTEATDEGKEIAKLQQLVGRASLHLRTAVADGAEPATRTVQRLREVIDAADPLALVAERYTEPSLLAEDVLFCRRLLTDMDTALELSAMRHYLRSAVIPDSAGNLAIDRRVTLEQMPGVALFNEPFLMDQMRATFEFYRHRYIAGYQEHHRAYWAACARLSRELDEAEPTARALDWLNSLRELGKATGINALAQYNDLRRSLDGCSLQGALSDSLRSATVCPMCRVTLADEPPAAEAHDIIVRLQRALRRQQNRLSSTAIRRILSEGKEEKVEQFLQVVQASDLHALAELLDKELVDFLRELLSSPQAPASDLLDRFSHECPEITEESLDEAVGMFRRLLREALASAQTVDPLHKPRIVLGRKTAHRAIPADGQAQRQI